MAKSPLQLTPLLIVGGNKLILGIVFHQKLPKTSKLWQGQAWIALKVVTEKNQACDLQLQPRESK